MKSKLNSAKKTSASIVAMLNPLIWETFPLKFLMVYFIRQGPNSKMYSILL